MNIAPIRQTDRKNPYFEGTIKIKGPNWTPEIAKAFMDSELIQNLAKGNRDVVGRISARKVTDIYDPNHSIGTILYKLFISRPIENSRLSRWADNLHLLKRAEWSKGYHREESVIASFDSDHFKYMMSQF